MSEHAADARRLDRVFDALSDPVRREVLCLLYEEGTLSGERIEDRLAAAFDRTRAEVRTDMYHTHLPKLEATGLVEHDARSGVVRYGDDPLVSRLIDEELTACRSEGARAD